MTVTVAVADSAVAPMYEQFTALILTDYSGGSDGFGLGLMDGSEARVTSASNSPFASGGHYMLIFRHMLLMA